MDVLGDKNQDMTFEQILKFVEAKEAGKRSASCLLLPQATDAVAGSSYRKQKKPSTKGPPPKNQDTCTYCGTKGHGKSPPTKIRRTKCPAFGTKCNHCGKDHHFEKVCRNKEPMKNAGHEDAISDTLCEITSTDKAKGITLDHHVFDQSTKEWLKRQSQSQPYIRLQVSVDREDHNLFGFPLTAPLKQSFVSTMADTGCQSCLAGINIVKKLGLTTGDLIPVSLRMHAADNHNIHILGRHHTEIVRKRQQGDRNVHQADSLRD